MTKPSKPEMDPRGFVLAGRDPQGCISKMTGKPFAPWSPALEAFCKRLLNEIEARDSTPTPTPEKK